MNFQDHEEAQRRDMKVRVIVVDDHAIFREGLRAVIAHYSGLEVVGEAADAKGALALAQSLHPDVAVVDFTLEDSDGLQLARELSARTPQCHVLLLTAHSPVGLLAEARAAGVSGFALKTEPTNNIVDAIRCVAGGGQYFSGAEPSGTAAAKENFEARCRNAIPELSRREREVFVLVVNGLSNEQLARQLHISVKTIETHRASINRKLNLHCTADLVRFAALRGLLTS